MGTSREWVRPRTAVSPHVAESLWAISAAIPSLSAASVSNKRKLIDSGFAFFAATNGRLPAVRNVLCARLLLGGSEYRAQAGLRAVPILRQEAELSRSHSFVRCHRALWTSADLFGRGNKGLSVDVELDGTFISEHVSKSHKLLWIKKNLGYGTLSSECVVKKELVPGYIVSQRIVFNAFRRHVFSFLVY
jgi:hypothetical protein